MAHPYGKYSVVRYPQYYVVIDESTPEHKIVFETRDKDKAHRKAKQLHKQAQKEREE
jgi:hypothetical protein